MRGPEYREITWVVTEVHDSVHDTIRCIGPGDVVCVLVIVDYFISKNPNGSYSAPSAGERRNRSQLGASARIRVLSFSTRV